MLGRAAMRVSSDTALLDLETRVKDMAAGHLPSLRFLSLKNVGAPTCLLLDQGDGLSAEPRSAHAPENTPTRRLHLAREGEVKEAGALGDLEP